MKTLLFAYLFLLASCAHFTGQDNQTSPKYQITQVDNPKENRMAGTGKVKISYEDYDQVNFEAEERIKNELLSEDNAKALRSQVPSGGRFVVSIFRQTVEGGNLKNFSYILYKNDKELARAEGGARYHAVDSVPSTPINNGLDGNYWTNSDVVDIPNIFTKDDSVKLFVIDKLHGGRDEFELRFKNPSK